MVVDFKVIDDENEADDDTVPLQKSTEDKVMSTPTTNRVMIFMELVKTFLLFVICVILGLLLRPPPPPPRDFTSGAAQTHTTTHVEDAQVVPLGDRTLPTELRGNSTEPPAPTDWEYKLIIWDPTYVEDCQATSSQWDNMKSDGGNGFGPYCYCGDSPCNAEIGPDVINPNDDGSLVYKRSGLVPSETPCNTCGRNSFESKSSFVSTALKEGLTRDEMFTECHYPTSTRSIKYWHAGQEGYWGGYTWVDLTDEQFGASHYNFYGINITVGVSLEVVELEVVSCVMEKLVNRIAEGGWEFIPSPTVDTLYFRKQKV